MPNRKKVKRRFQKKSVSGHVKATDMYDKTPVNPGVQQVSRSLKEFMQLKSLGKQSQHKLKKYNDGFRKSVSTEVGEVSKSANLVTPTVTNFNSNQKNKDLDEESKILLKEAKVSARANTSRKKKNLKLRQKRKLKQEQKNKKCESDTLDLVKDQIHFGEVVHRPPQITVRPRHCSSSNIENKPKKDNLLLKSMFTQMDSSLCGKRKYLSISDQRQIESERQKAIFKYKNMKTRIKHC